MTKIPQVNQAYTFSRIFELKIEPDDLAAEFGYTFQRSSLQLPQYPGPLARLEERRDITD